MVKTSLPHLLHSWGMVPSSFMLYSILQSETRDLRHHFCTQQLRLPATTDMDNNCGPARGWGAINQ